MTPHARIVTLEALMKSVALGDFAAHFGFLTSFHAQVTVFEQQNKTLKMNKEIHAMTLAKTRILLDVFHSIELPVTESFINSIIIALEQRGVLVGELIEFSGQSLLQLDKDLEYMRNIINREMGSKKFYILTPIEARLIEPDVEIWTADFRTKFPSALYDLDESAKCQAFGRGTACVFHLMRVVEIGLRATYICLGISVPLLGTDRNWGAILGRIRDAISSKSKSGWPDRDLFQEFYLLFDSVKDAWRNGTMHVEIKYTPATRSLMLRLASRMDENGEPKA
jgi:hypothetical protein